MASSVLEIIRRHLSHRQLPRQSYRSSRTIHQL